MKNWKELKRQKIRAKIEQERIRSKMTSTQNYARSTLRNAKIFVKRDVTVRFVMSADTKKSKVLWHSGRRSEKYAGGQWLYSHNQSFPR